MRAIIYYPSIEKQRYIPSEFFDAPDPSAHILVAYYFRLLCIYLLICMYVSIRIITYCKKRNIFAPNLKTEKSLVNLCMEQRDLRYSKDHKSQYIFWGTALKIQSTEKLKSDEVHRIVNNQKTM